jgi:ankyrin repeat protein
MARRARPRFHGPAAGSALGEALLDVIGIVSAVGFAADVSQCAQLCGVTFRAGDRGATNDMLVQSLRLQCGAREARAAGREDFLRHAKDVNDDDDEDDVVEGTTQLIRAALLNNLPRVLQLIQLGAPLDLVDEMYGRSALHWASREGHEHVVKALLDGKYEGRGATIDLRKSGMTALMRASQFGRESVVRLLLSRGAKQELQSNIGYTALHRAVEGNRPGVIALLCAAPSAAAALALKTSAAFVGSRTPLALAILYDHAACEAVLRAHGAPE